MEKQLGSLSHPSISSVIGEDPWNELLQSSCVDLSGSMYREAGSRSVQPLVFPIDPTLRSVYLWIRSIWAQPSHPAIPACLRNPFVQSFEPSKATAYLLAKRWECISPSIAPIQFPSGGVLFDSALSSENKLPKIAELCQLALLWFLADEKEASFKLIRWLFPFLDGKPILSLWCPENGYDEKEELLSASLLFRAMGKNEKAAELLRSIKTPIDPFFSALASATPRIELTDGQSEKNSDPDLGLACFKNQNMRSVFSLTGWESSMGAIQSGDVEIRAMGPQTIPLQYAKDFGISLIPDGTPLNNWTRSAALPEVWIQMKTASNEDCCTLDLRFIGLKPEEPLAFVFYAKAESCQIGNAVFKPKSLSRFSGEANCVSLKGRERNLKIETPLLHKAQLIPLAGEGCFWDAEFLIAFEIHPVTSSANFLFRNF